ncbi:hypothetical protein EHO61_10150 [Leptospira fluminis]|uniref:Lipoprotein n=1 Tax=Leptospira fluminis TaxID=2484979 RepID=A0A4R9GPR5_9LEPT|nr:hypothetical protein EHO61_10150 [Leptospira fluminis]
MKNWKAAPTLILLATIAMLSLGSCKKSSSNSNDLTTDYLLYISGQCAVTLGGSTKYVPPQTLKKGQTGTASFIAATASVYISAVTIVVSVSDQVTVTIPAGSSTMTYTGYLGACPINTNNGTITTSTQFTGGTGGGLNGTATATYTTAVAGTYTVYFSGAPITNPAITVGIQ